MIVPYQHYGTPVALASSMSVHAYYSEHTIGTNSGVAEGAPKPSSGVELSFRINLPACHEISAKVRRFCNGKVNRTEMGYS